MTSMGLWAKDYSPARMAHDSSRGIILGRIMVRDKWYVQQLNE
jgi:hypothetical protein